jgi:ATP-dependent RNA helicase RhlE
VATDIAARGIDIEELGCVFNYNLPDVPETYVHRIGRTGRAGHDGIAISFCQFDEQAELKSIQKLLGRTIDVVEDHPFPMENFEQPKKDKHGRPVNAEDAEARAAAKERRRQRDAENKARAEAKKLAAAQKTEPKPAVVEEVSPKTDAPAKKKRKKKKKKPAEAPVEMQSSTENVKPVEKKEPASAPVRERTTARGMRQGSLADTLPSDPSMPVADFVKPNPLDADVIMDATARLLAPRKPVAVSAPVVPAPKRAEEEKGTPAPKQEQSKNSKKKKKGKKTQTSAPAVEEKPKQQPAPGKQKSKGEERETKPVPKAANKKNNRKSRGGSNPANHKSDRQKDSTQQKSLMKPYYISHED